MVCPAGIYTVMNSPTATLSGSKLELGTTIRRFGCGISQEGDGIILKGSGYYLINASITLTPEAAGTVTVNLLQDGTQVSGATGSETVAAAGTPTNISITSIVKLSCCGDAITNLSLELIGGNATVNNTAITIVKA